MTERAYTVREIDALRRAVENKWLYGRYDAAQLGNCYGSRCYSEPEKTKCVEEIVRTWMLSGMTSEDLYASERAAPTVTTSQAP